MALVHPDENTIEAFRRAAITEANVNGESVKYEGKPIREAARFLRNINPLHQANGHIRPGMSQMGTMWIK